MPISARNQFPGIVRAVRQWAAGPELVESHDG